MGYDPNLEGAEEMCREADEKAVFEDAAVLVIAGYSRAGAVAKAREISDYQREAADDITGTIGTLAEAQSPKRPAGKKAQIEAIAQSLQDEFGD